MPRDNGNFEDVRTSISQFVPLNPMGHLHSYPVKNKSKARVKCHKLGPILTMVAQKILLLSKGPILENTTLSIFWLKPYYIWRAPIISKSTPFARSNIRNTRDF